MLNNEKQREAAQRRINEAAFCQTMVGEEQACSPVPQFRVRKRPHILLRKNA